MSWVNDDGKMKYVPSIATVRMRFGKIGRLTPENKIIADVVDSYLGELLDRLELLERKVGFRPKDME